MYIIFIWCSNRNLTAEIHCNVGRGVETEQLLPVARDDFALAVSHRPLAGDGQSRAFYLEPVPALGVSDRAVISGEGEELLPELENSQLLPEVGLALW